VSDQITVLFANESFYAAFAGRELHAMNDVWSMRQGVTCIHPGWPLISGREAVMRSWHGILSGPAAPAITCRNSTAHVFGDIAYVVCQERVEQGWMIATNIFVREDGRWRMLHHQAGSTPPPSADDGDTLPSLQ
jgi:ketosteroid isomerase-like protein